MTFGGSSGDFLSGSLSRRAVFFLIQLQLSGDAVQTRLKSIQLSSQRVAPSPTMSSLGHRTAAPKSSDFTPLQEHQQQTPSTFFGAKPVLYVHHAGLTISAPKARLQSDDAFGRFSSEPEGASEDDVLVKDVEAWVNSECAPPSCPLVTATQIR